ncbi:transposase [Bacillaceae bacterium S4-13-56]
MTYRSSIRGDSRFATPELYKLCEELGGDNVIRLKANQRLQRIAEEFVEKITFEIDTNEG